MNTVEERIVLLNECIKKIQNYIYDLTKNKLDKFTIIHIPSYLMVNSKAVTIEILPNGYNVIDGYDSCYCVELKNTRARLGIENYLDYNEVFKKYTPNHIFAEAGFKEYDNKNKVKISEMIVANWDSIKYYLNKELSVIFSISTNALKNFNPEKELDPNEDLKTFMKQQVI